MLLPTYAKNAANKRKPYSLTQIYIQKCTILLLFQCVFTGSQYAKIRKKAILQEVTMNIFLKSWLQIINFQKKCFQLRYRFLVPFQSYCLCMSRKKQFLSKLEYKFKNIIHSIKYSPHIFCRKLSFRKESELKYIYFLL